MDRRGPDAIEFVNGLSTNSTGMHDLPPGGLQASAMLNSKGRTLSELVVWRSDSVASDSEQTKYPALWLDCSTSAASEVVRILKTMRLRKRVKIDERSDLVIQYSLNSSGEVSKNDDFEVVLCGTDPRALSGEIGRRVIQPRSESVSDMLEQDAIENRQLAAATLAVFGIFEGSTVSNRVPLEWNME